MAALIAHALADIIPKMSADEYEALKADIKEHGQRVPIVLLDGRIIDGRNREQVCRELGIKPKTKQYDGNGSVVAYVWSMNGVRRHLTTGQRAMVAAEMEPYLAEEAKKRQKEHGKTAPGKKAKHLGKELPKCTDDGKAAQQAAKLTNTNRQYVADAKKLKADAPELAAAVRDGKMTLPQAKKAASPPKPKPASKHPELDILNRWADESACLFCRIVNDYGSIKQLASKEKWTTNERSAIRESFSIMADSFVQRAKELK